MHQSTSYFSGSGITLRTTGSEGRVSWVLLYAGVPPEARHRSHESGTEVESKEAGVSERREDGRDGEIIRQAIEE